MIRSARQFRTPTPPSLTSAEYTTAYNQVELIGGDGIVTPTVRTEEQTEIGIYWAYDGTPSLCAPPRLYNQIAMHIADQMGTTANASELARLLALVNTSMADAAIAIWESKYFYQYWRPMSPAFANPIRAPGQPALAMEIPRPLAIQAFRRLAHRPAI